MEKKKSNAFLIFSVIFYAVMTGLMIFGTLNDLEIDKVLYHPDNSFTMFIERFGQFTYWGIWGVAFAVIFLCRRDLNGCLSVIGKVFPFVKTVENTNSKAYKIFDFIVKAVTTVGFFVLCGIGWKKLIENVIKNILAAAGKDNLSQAVYFIISFVVAVISIILMSKIDKKTLKKLEALSLAGVLFGILIKIAEECKPISSRIRFREMIAYSNGFLNEEGLSEGKDSPLTREMINGTDFSAFTPWYKKGDNMGIYNRADSFPSGHTLSSCAVFLSVLLCNTFEKLKKLAPFALCVSTVYVVIMAYTRLIMGAHYLTDVVGAAIIGYTAFVIVRSIYLNFTKRGIIGE